MKRIIVILIAGVVGALPAPVHADDPHQLRPNLRVFQEEMRLLADSVFASVRSAPDTTCRFTVQPALHAWYLDQPVIDAVRSRGLTPLGSASAHLDATFGVERLAVSYENPRRTWVFGEQIVDRVISMAGSVKVVEQTTGAVLVARSFTSSVRDTVPVVSLESLETPGIPATHGLAPGSGVFPALIEPLVIIGSVAVAIYLLFSVRS